MWSDECWWFSNYMQHCMWIKHVKWPVSLRQSFICTRASLIQLAFKVEYNCWSLKHCLWLLHLQMRRVHMHFCGLSGDISANRLDWISWLSIILFIQQHLIQRLGRERGGRGQREREGWSTDWWGRGHTDRGVGHDVGMAEERGRNREWCGWDQREGGVEHWWMRVGPDRQRGGA